MSIAAAIRCDDGIALCADSQETIDQYFKTHKPKLEELDLISPDVKVVVVSAGDSVFIDVLTEKISEKIDLTLPHGAAIQTAIDSAVKEVCASNWPLYSTQADKPQARMLIGVKAIDGMFLFDVATPMVKTADKYVFIGCGYDLAIYKAKQLFKASMPVELAAGFLIHVLEVVKANVEFCGGDTRLAIMSPSGVEHKTLDYITTAEKGHRNWATLMDYLSAVLPLATTPDGRNLLHALSELEGDADQAGFDRVLASVVKQSKERREAFEAVKLQNFPALLTCLNDLVYAIDALGTNLHNEGVVSEDVYKVFHDRFSRAGQMASKAVESSPGDFAAARGMVAECINILSGIQSEFLLDGDTTEVK